MSRDRPSPWCASSLALAVGALAVMATACVLDGNTNSESHFNFMMPCLTQRDCAAEYACICGLCTLACESDPTCAAASDQPARCNDFSGDVSSQLCVLGRADRPSACLPTCASWEDCAAFPEGDRLSCVDGVCLRDPDLDLEVGLSGGDNNNWLDEAETIQVLSASRDWLWPVHGLPVTGGVRGRIDAAENPDANADRDYFALSVDGPYALAVLVEADEPDLVGGLDPYVRVMTSDGEVIAAANDAIDTFAGGRWGPSGTEAPDLRGARHFDPELVVRLPSAGRYVVEVQDYGLWSEQGVANAPGGYRLLVGTLGGPGVFEDPEGDELGVEREDGPLVYLGTLDFAGDVDRFRLTVDGPTILHAQVVSETEEVFGGVPLEVSILRRSDGSVIARRAAGNDVLAPSVDAGVYELRVSQAEGSDAGLGYYVVKLDGIDEGVREEADCSLQSPLRAPAEADGAWLTAFLGDGDEDVLAFEVSPDRGTISFRCWSRRQGSGVLGLTAHLVDPDGSGKVDWTEDEWGTRPASSAARPGTYTLRLSKAGQDSEVTGNWVHCFIAAE